MKCYKQDPYKMKILKFVQRYTNCRKDKQGKYTLPAPLKRQAHILGLTYPLPQGWIKLIKQTSLTRDQRTEFMLLYKKNDSIKISDDQRQKLIKQKKIQDFNDLKKLAVKQKKQRLLLL